METSGNLHESLGRFYIWLRHKFAMKALLCNNEYIYLFDRNV